MSKKYRRGTEDELGQGSRVVVPWDKGVVFRCPLDERQVYVAQPPHTITFDDQGLLTLDGSVGSHADESRGQPQTGATSLLSTALRRYVRMPSVPAKRNETNGARVSRDGYASDGAAFRRGKEQAGHGGTRAGRRCPHSRLRDSARAVDNVSVSVVQSKRTWSASDRHQTVQCGSLLMMETRNPCK